MEQLITVVVSALIGAIVAYLGNLWQARRFIHEKIHQSRARLYPEAWQLTGLLPLRPQSKTLTYESLNKLAIELQAWYYREGGIYLSGGARRAYSAYQDAIAEVCQSCGPAECSLSEEHYQHARKAGSQFRTWLTRDLLSRSRAPLGKKRHWPEDH